MLIKLPVLLILMILLNDCVSVWPDVCTHSWRGVVDCKCNNEIKFRVYNVSSGKKLTVLCDGKILPISAEATQVTQ